MINETIKGILLTSYCTFNGKISQPIKEIVNLSRLDMIDYLSDEVEEIDFLGIDIKADYHETITFLKSISDEEYQEIREGLVLVEN